LFSASPTFGKLKHAKPLAPLKRAINIQARPPPPFANQIVKRSRGRPDPTRFLFIN
jgi:hypothetical protein